MITYRILDENGEESTLQDGDQIVVDLRREVYYFVRGGKTLRRRDDSIEKSIKRAPFDRIQSAVRYSAYAIGLEAHLAIVNDEEVVNDFARGLKVGRAEQPPAEQPPIYTFVLVKPS